MWAAFQRVHLATPQGLLYLALLVILPIFIGVPLVVWLGKRAGAMVLRSGG